MKQSIVDVFIALREATEGHFHVGVGDEKRLHLADGDLGGGFDGVVVNAR